MAELPREVSEYFAKGRRSIESVVANNDYTLTIVFDNNEVKIYDMKDKLRGVLSALKDINKFKECFVDEVGNIAWDIDKNVDSRIVWNNRIDLCTDSVYIYSKSIN